MSGRYMLVFVLLAVCLGTAVEGRRGGGHRRGPKWNRLICEMKNVTSGLVVFTKTCGCEDETSVACDVGPVAFTGKCGEQLEAKFCAGSDRLLSMACNINGVANFTCRGGDTCDLGPVTTTVGGASYVLLFCKPAPRDGAPACGRERESSSSSEDECVQLSREASSASSDGRGPRRPGPGPGPRP